MGPFPSYRIWIGLLLLSWSVIRLPDPTPAPVQPATPALPSYRQPINRLPTRPTVTLMPPLPRTPVGQAGTWKLYFTADFTEKALTNDWVTCFWWDDDGCTIATNHELQWYQPGNVMVGGGVLRLQAREEAVRAPDGRQFAYTSGMVSSGRLVDNPALSPGFAFQYGYVEMRAKAPRGQGLWTALWLLPTDHTSRPEIDVMELLGHEPGTVQMHFHYDQADGQERHVGDSWTGPDLTRGWHIFAVDWQPDQLIWYVDGVERWRFTDKAYIPAEPMYLLATLAVGGDWPGAPDAQTSFPSTLLLDYIRVWRQQD